MAWSSPGCDSRWVHRMKQAGMAACVAVLLWAVWVMLGNLGQEPLVAYDEGTYAQVVQESFERGDFLSFTLYGNSWFEKPPLYFWLAGAATYVTADPVLGIRLPAALFGIAVVALVMFLAYRASHNYFVAAFAGAFLLSIAPFVQGAREARLDTAVVFFTLLAYWAAWEALAPGLRKPNGWFAVFGAAAGFAVLSKSVVGAFAAAALPLWALWLNDWRFVRDKRFWRGILIAFVIAAPWHLYEWWRWGGEFWAQYVGYHVLERYETNLFMSPDLQTDYLARLYERARAPLLAFFAALLALPVAASARSRTELAPLVTALGLVACMALAFFTAETRAMSYLIPIYPFAALFVALLCWRLFIVARKGVIR